jgi:hypothetical protein
MAAYNKTRAKEKTMKTFYLVVAAAASVVLGMYGCNGCREMSNYYVPIVNTLPQVVSLEYRQFFSQDSRTVTIGPETSVLEYTHSHTRGHTPKAGTCDDSYTILFDFVEFSNATLSQYTVCYSEPSPVTYAVLSSSATCSGNYPNQQTTGW